MSFYPFVVSLSNHPKYFFNSLLKEVGKIKVLSYAGEDYIKAEVVDGTVQNGDVAKKGNVASLVSSSSERCK